MLGLMYDGRRPAESSAPLSVTHRRRRGAREYWNGAGHVASVVAEPAEVRPCCPPTSGRPHDACPRTKIVLPRPAVKRTVRSEDSAGTAPMTHRPGSASRSARTVARATSRRQGRRSGSRSGRLGRIAERAAQPSRLSRPSSRTTVVRRGRHAPAPPAGVRRRRPSAAPSVRPRVARLRRRRDDARRLPQTRAATSPPVWRGRRRRGMRPSYRHYERTGLSVTRVARAKAT